MAAEPLGRIVSHPWIPNRNCRVSSSSRYVVPAAVRNSVPELVHPEPHLSSTVFHLVHKVAVEGEPVGVKLALGRDRGGEKGQEQEREGGKLKKRVKNAVVNFAHYDHA